MVHLLVPKRIDHDASYTGASEFDSVSPFSPSQLTNLVQRFLDAPATPYHAQTLQSFPVLSPEEPGTVAVPRGQRCAMFDGVNDFATLGARLTSGSVTALTACAWIKCSATSSYKNVLSEWTATTNYSWIFSVAPTAQGGGMEVALSGNGIALYVIRSAGSVQDGAWHHLAFTYNGSVVAIYIDGVDVTSGATVSGSVPASLFNTSAPFAIAASSVNTTPTAFFPGSMRDARVYNRVLSPTAIAAIFNQASTPSTIDTTGLLGMWPLQSESGTTEYDASGNGRHLTLKNITQSTFHATDSGVTYNYNNERGYTLGRNMLARSQEFSNAAPWNIYSGAMTFTANGATAPDGSMTAEIVTWASGLSARYMYQSVPSVSGVRHTLSVWLRSQSGTVVIGLRDASSNTQTTATATTTWQRFTFTFVSAIAFIEIGIDQRQSTITGVSESGTVEIWGMQLEIASSATDYQATGATGFTPGTIIPASLSNPTLDAAGNALGNVGPICKPATVEVPCVTGDGAAAYVDLGSALIPATADFSLSLWYFHTTNDTTTRTILSQRETTNPNGRLNLVVNSVNGTPTAGGLTFFVNNTTNFNASISSALTANSWHYITVSRSGSVFTVTCQSSGGSQQAASLTTAVTLYTGRNSWLMASQTGSIDLNGRISDFRITTGGVTRYFPLQGGPGTSNTNRDVHWVASDGTGGVVSNAIVNGTVANIWANRCPYAQDWSINYGGGIAANGAFIPGRIGSNLDAAGNAKTLSAGEQSPYALIYPNRWGAPELVNVGITSSTAWGKTTAVQNVSPADTKFRNTTKGTKNFVVSSPLTGSDKTNAEAYVA